MSQFEFAPQSENELLFQEITELQETATELGVEMPFTFGLSAELEVSQLQSAKELLSDAIDEAELEAAAECGLCIAGFKWIRQSNGNYRCAGGSHFITKENLRKQMKRKNK